MKTLKILVCIKQVADPEGPASSFEIDRAAMRVAVRGIPPVLNPFDASALEVALRIKDGTGAQITALNMVDDKLSMVVMKKALAAGADDLVLLQDKSFLTLDAVGTAYVLSSAIRKIGECSLVLVGRQTADWGSGQVGSIMGEMLGIPAINPARSVTIEDDRLVVERIRRSGSEVLGVAMPAVIAVDTEAGELRLPSLKDIKDAAAKPVRTYDAAGLGLDPARLRPAGLRDLLPPPSRRRQCAFIEGPSPKEKAVNLAARLRADRVL